MLVANCLTPARVWRFVVDEPPRVDRRNEQRERVVDTLARHGLELVTAEPAGGGRSTLYVSAAHRIPRHVAAAAAAAVPGFVSDTLEHVR